MSYLKELSEELSNITPEQLVEPDGEFEPNDLAVGKASDEIRRIYTLMVNTKKLGIECVKELISAEDCKKTKEIANKAYKLKRKYEMLVILFWSSLREEFNLWNKSSVGIRKGFVVVWNKGKEEKEEKTPGKCDEDCGNCKTGSALKSIARSADGDEIIGKILPLILLSKLVGEMKNLGAKGDEED